MARRSSGKAVRLLALVAAAGCSPGVGWSVGRAGPPGRSAPVSASSPGSNSRRGPAGAQSASGPSGPAQELFVSDPAVQPLVVRAWALERSRRFREAAKAYLQAASAVTGGDSDALHLLVRAGKLYLRAGRLTKAYLVLESARKRARLGFERLFVLRTMADMVGRMGATMSVVRLYGRLRRSPAGGLLGPLVAAYWLEHRQPDKAAQVLRESRKILAPVETLLASDRTAVPGRVGLLVTLQGPYRLAGRSLIRGAMLALMGGASNAGVWRSLGGISGPRVWIEPVDGDAGAAVRRLRVLGKVAVALGPVWPAKARDAAMQAQRMNLALVTVSPDRTVAGIGTQVFDYIPDAGRRLTQLFDAVVSDLHCRRARARTGRGRARRRCRRGRRRRRRLGSRCLQDWSGPVALILPEGSYGRALAASLGAIRPGGFESFTYKNGQTTFSALVSQLKRRRVAGVVAVMGWGTLELFAPQMAAAGLWPGRGPKGVRTVVFGALGDGVAPDRLALAGRYLEGTVLVPGFYPDEGDARWGGFVADYRRAYGTLPDLVAAYAYEAATLAARSVRGPELQGAASRLAASTIRGARVFDGKGVLARPSTVYRVSAGKLTAWRRRACRGGRARGGRWRRKR